MRELKRANLPLSIQVELIVRFQSSQYSRLRFLLSLPSCSCRAIPGVGYSNPIMSAIVNEGSECGEHLISGQ